MTMRPTFSERDGEILARRAAQLAENPINVGDFVRFADGVVRRVSYIWPDISDDDSHHRPGSIQTTDGGSFYLGDGYVSFSGSLYIGVPFNTLTNTGDTHDGQAWFFHHDHACADNGVYFTTKFRVWHCSLKSERC
jgi:hypothetical protein